MGKSVDIWWDAWIPSLCNFQVFSTPKPPDLMLSKVESLIDWRSGCWNSQLIRSMFTPDEVSAIEKVSFSVSGNPDSLKWAFSLNGVSYVKSGNKDSNCGCLFLLSPRRQNVCINGFGLPFGMLTLLQKLSIFGGEFSTMLLPQRKICLFVSALLLRCVPFADLNLNLLSTC